jgi:ketosteroid isomerase-like protein
MNPKAQHHMKKIIYSMFVAVILITACQPKTETLSVDPITEKDTIARHLDAMYAAYTTKDISTILASLTEDCLFCGTDPNEFWDKEGYATLLKNMAADSSYVPPAFELNKREIRLDKSGTSAIVVDQLYIARWTNKIPVRGVTHHIKADNKWLIDFSSMSFVPNNADLEKIFNSVAE